MGKKRTLMDLTGLQFYDWTVIKLDRKEKSHTYWLCRCVCGKEKSVSSQNLRTGRSKSCGCGKFRNRKKEEDKVEPKVNEKKKKDVITATFPAGTHNISYHTDIIREMTISRLLEENNGMMISNYISYKEACVTNTGIANTLPLTGYVWDNAFRLANTILDRIREFYGRPIIVHSFFRNRIVNEAVGGSRTSAHVLGSACDFHIKDVPLEKVYEDIANCVIKDEDGNPLMDNIDQVIHEPGWIHIGISKNPRRQRLVAKVRNNGVVGYEYYNTIHTEEYDRKNSK